MSLSATCLQVRLSSNLRLKFLFDEGNYEKTKIPNNNNDPLSFKDKRKYKDRLKEARKKTKENDAVVIAEGKIKNIPVVAIVFDFHFMGGSMGVNVGDSIVKGSEISIKKFSSSLNTSTKIFFEYLSEFSIIFMIDLFN